MIFKKYYYSVDYSASQTTDADLGSFYLIHSLCFF